MSRSSEERWFIRLQRTTPQPVGGRRLALNSSFIWTHNYVANNVAAGMTQHNDDESGALKLHPTDGLHAKWWKHVEHARFGYVGALDVWVWLRGRTQFCAHINIMLSLWAPEVVVVVMVATAAQSVGNAIVWSCCHTSWMVGGLGVVYASCGFSHTFTFGPGTRVGDFRVLIARCVESGCAWLQMKIVFISTGEILPFGEKT